MSTFYLGHSVPMALRRLPPISVNCLDGSVRTVPDPLHPALLSSFIFCFNNKQAWDTQPWLDIISKSDNLIATPLIVFLSPTWKRPFQCLWQRRCSSWAVGMAPGSVGAAYLDRVTWKSELGILNEDLTNFILSPGGEIVFCAQGKFSPRNFQIFRTALKI